MQGLRHLPGFSVPRLLVGGVTMSPYLMQPREMGFYYMRLDQFLTVTAAHPL